MSDPAPPTKPAKPKGGKGRIMLALLAFFAGVAAGSGGAGIGIATLGGLSGLGGGHAAKATAHEPAKLEYVEIDNSFTSNLIDTGRYLQLRIAVSTSGGPDVVAALTQHKLAVVSTVLTVLGDLAENDVAGRPAKAKLKLRLREAIDTVLRQKASVGGIDEVFLTSLVVQ